MTSLLGRTLLAELLCLAYILMQLLSDGARFVQLVVFIVSLYFSDLLPVFLPSVILPFSRLVPLVVVVVPFCVFSQSEMLNASLISSFIRPVSSISSFIRLVSSISSFIRLVSTISSFIRLVSFTTLSFELGLPFLCPFLRDPFTRSVPAIPAILLLPFPYTCATFLGNLFLFPLTKLYDILRGNSHWPYSLTKYFTFTIV